MKCCVDWALLPTKYQLAINYKKFILQFLEVIVAVGASIHGVNVFHNIGKDGNIWVCVGKAAMVVFVIQYRVCKQKHILLNTFVHKQKHSWNEVPLCMKNLFSKYTLHTPFHFINAFVKFK